MKGKFDAILDTVKPLALTFHETDCLPETSISKIFLSVDKAILEASSQRALFGIVAKKLSAMTILHSVESASGIVKSYFSNRRPLDKLFFGYFDEATTSILSYNEDIGRKWKPDSFTVDMTQFALENSGTSIQRIKRANEKADLLQHCIQRKSGRRVLDITNGFDATRFRVSCRGHYCFPFASQVPNWIDYATMKYHPGPVKIKKLKSGKYQAHIPISIQLNQSFMRTRFTTHSLYL